MNVLVTGGAGYIGSVCTEQLLDAGPEMSLSATIEAEVVASYRLTQTEDHQEAKRAFAEKRRPTFRGR